MTENEAIGILKDYRKGDFVGDDEFCEAIDTVLSLINTGNKTGLDERLQEKSIEVSDCQEGLSNKKDRLYTAEEMYLNMQYYMEYCQMKGYVTPMEWLEKHKHFGKEAATRGKASQLGKEEAE